MIMEFYYFNIDKLESGYCAIKDWKLSLGGVSC